MLKIFPILKWLYNFLSQFCLSLYFFNAWDLDVKMFEAFDFINQSEFESWSPLVAAAVIAFFWEENVLPSNQNYRQLFFFLRKMTVLPSNHLKSTFFERCFIQHSNYRRCFWEENVSPNIQFIVRFWTKNVLPNNQFTVSFY